MTWPFKKREEFRGDYGDAIMPLVTLGFSKRHAGSYYMKLSAQEMRVMASSLRMAAHASEQLDTLVDWLLKAAAWQEMEDSKNA